jgi:hypothetical protein
MMNTRTLATKRFLNSTLKKAVKHLQQQVYDRHHNDGGDESDHEGDDEGGDDDGPFARSCPRRGCAIVTSAAHVEIKAFVSGSRTAIRVERPDARVLPATFGPRTRRSSARPGPMPDRTVKATVETAPKAPERPSPVSGKGPLNWA